MAKLTRVYQKQFGSSGTASDFGQFGSLGQGAAVTTKDPAEIQNGAAFAIGWVGETVNSNRPSLEDFNGLDLLTFYQLGYIFQSGIPEYDASTPYFVGSLVNDGTGNIYKCILNSTGNALNSATYWSQINLLSALPDVLLNSVSDGQYLQYEAASSKWKNKTLSGFGAWASKTTDTVYLAATDGILVASGGWSVAIYSDASNPPTTLILSSHAYQGGGGDYAPITCPIRKGDYYKVSGGNSILWLPLGS